MDFDLELAREHTEKNPVFYAKYAYARLSGILRNAQKLKLPKPDLSLLEDQAELDLVNQLTQLPNLVSFIIGSKDYPVQHLTTYILETAKKFHYFYDQCRVIDEKNLELTAARLELVKATQIVLGIVGRDLIGIDMPEKM
jgi:arginyl-tRNA synthetase